MVHFYYYSIKNIITNKQYIGITGDIKARFKSHKNNLQNNTHSNPLLQRSWNKYGAENFVFEVLEEKDFESIKQAYEYEAILIKKFHTYPDGFNCNPGGQWTGPKGFFTEEEIYFIKSAYFFESDCMGVLKRIFNCSDAAIENIKMSRNYKPYCQNFDSFSEEKKKEIYERFCERYNFNELIKTKNIKLSARRFTKEQIFIIYRWRETKFITARQLCDSFGIDYPQHKQYHHANKFRGICEGRSYKEYFDEYNKMTEEEKQTYEHLYAARYIEEPL